MQESFRYLFFLLITLFILSFSLIQCQNSLPEKNDHQKKSLRNIDYINMCIFRKTRLCDFLRELDYARFERPRQEREIRKRGISRFYSNW